MPGPDDTLDLARQVLPDAGQFGQVLVRGDERPDALRQPLDGARRAAIGAQTKMVRAFDP